MKNIHLHISEEFFYMMSKDKLEREEKLGCSFTWEQYIAHIFGLDKGGIKINLKGAK